jgi:hypothetical protein
MLATSSYACIKPSYVHTALDAAQIACVLLTDAEDSSAVSKVCDIAEALIPDVQKLLEGRKQAAKRRAAAAADAGPGAGK